MSTPILLLLCLLLGTISGPVILTPPQVGRRWNCKADAVRQLLERGLLRGFKVGRCHWRVTLDAVEAYERGERPVPLQTPPRRRPRRAMQPIDGPF